MVSLCIYIITIQTTFFGMRVLSLLFIAYIVIDIDRIRYT